MSFNDLLFSTIERACTWSCKKIPYIVSVGCRSGKIEQDFFEQHQTCKMILVDHELPCSKGDVMIPCVKNVYELVNDYPNIVSNCLLLLLWPNPFKVFDLEAVKILKPLSIVTLYEEPFLIKNDKKISKVSRKYAFPEQLAGSTDFITFVKNTSYYHKEICHWTEYPSPVCSRFPKLVYLWKTPKLWVDII